MIRLNAKSADVPILHISLDNNDNTSSDVSLSKLQLSCFLLVVIAAYNLDDANF